MPPKVDQGQLRRRRLQGFVNGENAFIMPDGSFKTLQTDVITDAATVDNTADFGMGMINETMFNKGFQLAYGEALDTTYTQGKDIKLDPMINMAVSEAIIADNKKHLGLLFKKRFKIDFEKTFDEQTKLQIEDDVYRRGLPAFLRRVNSDPNFDPSDPMPSIKSWRDILDPQGTIDPRTGKVKIKSRGFDEGRAKRVLEGFNSRENPAFSVFIDKDNQQRAHIVTSSPDEATAIRRWETYKQRVKTKSQGKHVPPANQTRPGDTKASILEELTEDELASPHTKTEVPFRGPDPTKFDIVVEDALTEVRDTFAPVADVIASAIPQGVDPLSVLKAIDTPFALLRGVAARTPGERASGYEVIEGLGGMSPEQVQEDLRQAEVNIPQSLFEVPIEPLTSVILQGQREVKSAAEHVSYLDNFALAVEILPELAVGAGVTQAKKLFKRGKKVDPSQGTATGATNEIDLAPDAPSDLLMKDIDRGFDAEKVAMGDDLPSESISAREAPGIGPKTKSKTALMYRRAFTDTIETMRQLGPAAEHMANVMENTMIRYERGISELAFRQREIFTDIWGKRKAAAVKGAFRGATTRKFFNISQHESDAIVEYMSRHGENIDEVFAGKQWDLSPEQIQKVKETGDNLFKSVTFQVSNHPGIRNLEVFDPVTQTSKPAGAPSLFFPQNPLSDARKQLTKGGKFEMLYNAARDVDPDLTKTMFRFRLEERLAAYSVGKIRKAADSKGADVDGVRTFAGVEQARLFDPVHVAEMNGTSVAEVYRTLGYDDDPIRSITSYAIGGLKRGETGEVYQKLSQELDQVSEQLLRNPLTTDKHESWLKYVGNALNHFGGKGGGNLLDTEIKGWIGNVLGFNSATMLQAAGISNMAQFSVIGTQATFPSVFKGMVETMKKWRNPEIAERSGSMYITMAQEWQKPDSLFGKMAQDSLRLELFTASEKFLRVSATNIGKMHVLNIARNIQKPGGARHKLKWDGMAIEMGFDPTKLRKELADNGGSLSHESLWRGTKIFADKTAGRTDMRGLPLWAAEHKPILKALVQFKNFALVNGNAFEKMIFQAPTPMIGLERAIKASGLATIAGLSVNSVRDMLIKRISPLSEEGTFGQLSQETSKELANSILTGMGNVFGMILGATMAGEQGAADLLVGASGSMLVDAAGATKSAFEGTFDSRDLFGAVAGKVPAIPVFPKTVQQMFRDDIKQEKESNRLLRQLGIPVITDDEDPFGDVERLQNLFK